jgi:ubiquinol-cytochrome c reductase cytochrome c subunit
MAALLVLVLALGVTGVVYGMLTAAPKASAGVKQTVSAQELTEGKKLYITSCSSCHNLNAQGVKGMGPSLVGVGAAAVDFQVGTGRMPAKQLGAQIQAKKNTYTQSQIDAMAAYIGSLGNGPAIPNAAEYDPDAPPLPDQNGQTISEAQGGVLFRTNCSACHNFAGEGGVLTDGKYAPDLTGTTPKHIYEAMLTGPQNMPQFPDSVMPPAQKQAIIKYITSQADAPNNGGFGLGRLGPVPEGLALWVFGLAALIGVATWIGARSRKASAARLASYHAAQREAARRKSE